MKLAGEKKNPTVATPSAHQEGVPVTFFRHMAEIARISRKEFALDCRVSDTLVDGWFTGEKNDPFTQAKKALTLYQRIDRQWLIPGILAWIAGGDSFDGRILSKEQNDALHAALELLTQNKS